MSITIRRAELIRNPGYLCTCDDEYEEESMRWLDDKGPIKCKNCGGYVSVKQVKDRFCALKCNRDCK